jgi:hypothetical protein
MFDYDLPGGSVNYGDALSTTDVTMQVPFTFTYFNRTVSAASATRFGEVRLSTSVGTMRVGVYFAVPGYDHSKYSLYYRSETNPAVLEKLGALMLNSTYTNIPDTFAAKNAIVMTWHRNTYASSYTSGLLNSFQLIMTTDGTYSYLVLIYGDNQGAPFNAPTFYETAPGSAAFVGFYSSRGSNCGIRGQYILRVDAGSNSLFQI